MTHAISYVFKTKCRKRLEKKMSFVLPGLVNFDESDKFECTIMNAPEELRENLTSDKGWLQISPIKQMLSHPQDELIFKMLFAPMKPFKIIIDVLISKKTGGRWK